MNTFEVFIPMPRQVSNSYLFMNLLSLFRGVPIVSRILSRTNPLILQILQSLILRSNADFWSREIREVDTIN